MREPGAGDEVGTAEQSGRAGDGVGHERRALLVGHQDGPNAVRAAERVVELDVVGAGDAEGEGDALVLQGTYHDLGTAHLSRGHLVVPFTTIAASAE